MHSTRDGVEPQRFTLAKVDPEAPLEAACLFACGLSTGLGAAMNTEDAAEMVSALKEDRQVLPGRGLSLYGPCPACRTRSRLLLVPPP